MAINQNDLVELFPQFLRKNFVVGFSPERTARLPGMSFSESCAADVCGRARVCRILALTAHAILSKIALNSI